MIYFLICITVLFTHLFFDLTLNPEKYLKIKEKFFRTKKEKDESKDL